MKKSIYILGIHDGHNCGATLVCDGVIVASVSEERITRKKNEVGYPKASIDSVLKIGNIKSSDLDKVAYASLFMHSKEHLLDIESWYKVGAKEQKAQENQRESNNDYKKIIFESRKRERIDILVTHLSIDESIVEFIEHHLAHLTAAYYTRPIQQNGKPILGFTCDGAGDGVSATVSICEGNEFSRIGETSRHASLGKIYSRATMIMGMKPWEHEYKLMGMAPYADNDRCIGVVEELRKLLRVRDDGLGFEQASDLSTNYCFNYLKELYGLKRFDVFSGAIQLFTEEMMVSWIRKSIESTGITDIVCGGGSFMNVKANMLIAELPEVTSMYIVPSSSDESLSIGAALLTFYLETGKTDSQNSILRHLYLGGNSSDKEEELALEELTDDSTIVVSQPDDMEYSIAQLLSEGEIVARCRGAMEWGARSLGNRSILASADNRETVDEINNIIKRRDFWMPFAPSIREENTDKYFKDEKKLYPWFMTFAFRCLDEGYDDIKAGSHPRDKTIRPQVVTKEANSDYHRMLTYFEEMTGRGVVLNTSFNLHGYPIVCKPKDAIHVFKNSGLKNLALNNYLLKKITNS